MKFLQNVLKIFFVSYSFGTLIFAAESSAPIELSYTEINPPEAINIYNQHQFDQLIKLANIGIAKIQYALAHRYLSGINPQGINNLAEAEKWALKAREQDYLPAYTLLVEMFANTNIDQALQYSLEAVQRGFLEQNFNVGKLYEIKKNYSKARKYYLKAFDSKYRDAAQLNYALLLVKGKGGKKDIKEGISYYRNLAKKNDIAALYNLGMEYVSGNDIFKADWKRAYTYFIKTIDLFENDPLKNSHNKNFYHKSLNMIGLMLEKGFNDHKSNPAKAAGYFNKSSENIRGQVHTARMIIQGKIPGDIKQAVAVLYKASSLKDVIAILFAGLYLMKLHEYDDAVELFEQVLKIQDDQSSAIALLQLGIAYEYGFGVARNHEKAEQLFHKILSKEDDFPNRSTFLAKGYLFLFGLSVSKNISKGLDLINYSEKLFDNVFFTTEDLFPAITKLRLKIGEDLLTQISKVPENKYVAEKIDKPVVKISQSSSSNKPSEIDKNLTLSNQNAFTITPEEWNDYFSTQDGSYVSEINAQEKTITIMDPKRNEKLLVHVDHLPELNLSSIENLQMAPRIALRQGLGKKARPLDKSVIYDHSFAQMLDYVIQYAGEYVPFFKFGGGQAEDSLVANITRINLKTGEKREGTAEYTFRKKGEGFEVYHRLLRTRKNTAVVYLTYPTHAYCAMA